MFDIKKFIAETKLLNEIVSEVGDLKNIKPFKPEDKYRWLDGGQGADYRIGDDITLSIGIEKLSDYNMSRLELPPVAEDDNVYNIGYAINGNDSQYMKSDLKLLNRVIKTVIDFAIRHQKGLKGEDATYLVGATDKEGRGGIDPQKKRYYDVLIKRYTPTGWRTGDAEVGRNNFRYISSK